MLVCVCGGGQPVIRTGGQPAARLVQVNPSSSRCRRATDWEAGLCT